MCHQSCRLLFNNNKLERARKKAVGKQNSQPEGHSKLRRTSRGNEAECFLCEKEAPTSELRQVMTMHLEKRLNECAQKLNDGRLLAKLSEGDAIARELKYHVTCLTDLYNKERANMRSIKRQKEELPLEKDAFPLVFSELVIYIVETKTCCNGPAVF